MRRSVELVLAVLIAAVCFGAGPQGRLVKVWSLDVARAATNGQAEHQSVFALGFSEDSRRVAAVVGESWDREFVLIIDVASPNRPVRFDVNPKTLRENLHWSPSGDWLIIENTILRLQGEHVCSLPDTAIFPGYQFAWPYVVSEQLNPARISLFDTGCGLARNFYVRTSDNHDAVRISIADASSESDFLVVTPSDFLTQGATELLDIHSGEIRRRLPAGFGSAKFADNGRAICGAVGSAWHRSVDCVSTETGETISHLNGDWNGPDLRAAHKATRLVISDYARRPDFIDWRWYLGPLTKRVVWDYRLQKSIAEWKPRSQQQLLLGGARSMPYRFDISPDGTYIVEGGDTMLNLYRIEQ